MNSRYIIDVIEQAVGPIRATGARKDRMREELAAHLTASWEEERERGDDEEAAAERAVRRLGDLAELRRGLQESVPRFERWFFTPLPFLRWLDALDRVMRRRGAEAASRHAVRIAIGMTTVVAALDLIVVPASIAFKTNPGTDWPTVTLWAFASLLVVAVGGVVFTLLWEATVRAAQQANRMRLICCLVLSSLVVIGLGLGFVGMVSLGGRHGALFSWLDWPRLVIAALLAPPLLFHAARDERARRRGQGGWGITEIVT